MDILAFAIALALFLVSFVVNMILLDWMKHLERKITDIRTTQLEHEVFDFTGLPKRRTISVLGKEIYRKEE